MIRSSRLSYEAATEAFSPSHIEISNLRADINAPRLRRGDFAFSIKRMGFTGPSGFRLESLTANAALADSMISVDNLALTLPHSSLRIDDIALPTERLADVLCAMRSHGIEPKRLRFLAKSPDAAPSLLFVEGKRGGKSGLVIEPPLVPNGEEWDAVYFRK